MTSFDFSPQLHHRIMSHVDHCDTTGGSASGQGVDEITKGIVHMR